MVSGRRTIRIRGIPSDKTRDDILTFVAACCSAKDTKSRGLSFPFFRGRSNESPIVISGVGSSTEVTKTPRDDGEHVHTINISRLPMSIAVLEDRTQIATITLTNHEYYSRCLKADGDPEFLVDGTFDGLTILSSPEAAEIEYVLNPFFSNLRGLYVQWKLLPTKRSPWASSLSVYLEFIHSF